MEKKFDVALRDRRHSRLAFIVSPIPYFPETGNETQVAQRNGTKQYI